MGNIGTRSTAASDGRSAEKQPARNFVESQRISEEVRMLNVANILVERADGVPKDAPKSVDLYEKYISEGGDTRAMCKFAAQLSNGADKVPKDLTKAVQLYEKAICEGKDTVAMLNMANILYEGADRVPKDVPRATELYERAIREGGHTMAMYNLANVLCKGADGVPKDLPRAVNLYEDAIRESGYREAMFNLANIVREGADGVPKDLPRAAALYEEVIRKGGGEVAMLNLANILFEGADGVPRNAPKAVDLYEEAIREGGDTKAMYNLANILDEGADGVPKNVHRAVALYEEAILRGGHARAMFNLANIVREGADGVPKDVPRALKLYEEARREGADTVTMYNLAVIFRSGVDGVPRNIPRAINILDDVISANQVGPISQHAMIDLARIYLADDVGRSRDPKRAKDLLEQCIDQYKDMQAMHELAVLLQKGDVGVERNVSEADKLFKLARKEGTVPQSILFKRWEKEELLAGEHHGKAVELVLKAEKTRPRQCGLLVVGGAGRGKTSVVRSLQGMAFTARHESTELADLEQIVIIPGETRSRGRWANELVFNVESLTGNMTRAGSSRLLESQELLDAARAKHAAVDLDEISSRLRPIMQHTGEQETGKTCHVPHIESATLRVDFPGHATAVPSSTCSMSQVTVGCTESISRFAQIGRESFGNVILRSLRGLRTFEFPTGGSAALLHCFDLAGQEPYMMAHSLFIGAAEIVLVVVNLANIENKKKRKVEISTAGRWVEMVYNSCREPDSVDLIVVGTRLDDCKDPKKAFDILFNGFKIELGNSAYNAWFGSGNERRTHSVAIENRRAIIDPCDAGLEKLEAVIMEISERIVAAREEIPMRWIALVEELEAIEAIFLEKGEVMQFLHGFKIFGEDREKREEEAMRALRYYHRVGRLVLLEPSEDEFYAFCNPSVILDFVRQVTGPDEELLNKRLEQYDRISIEKGIITRDGLAKLWDGHSEEAQSIMLDLLCRFDLLMRIPGERNGEGYEEDLIAIPALLEKGVAGFKLEKRGRELELRAITKFVDVFPSGVMSTVISNLHRTLGGEQTEAGFLRSNAAILGVNLYLQNSGRVAVASNTDQRQIEWTVRAEKPVGMLRDCLQALSDCFNSPLRTVRTGRDHSLLADCMEAPEGCGGKDCVTFKLPVNWISSKNSSQTLPNVWGTCLCKERWKLHNLLPMVCRNMSDSFVQETVTLHNPSMPYDVFISHAGPQKANVAMPFLNEVKATLRCFLDVNDIQVRPEDQSEQIYAAIRGSKVFVFIVSLEAVMRKWPIRELRKCFELRDAAKKKGRNEPIILPLFYGLSVADCKDLELPFRDEYRETFLQNGFFGAVRQRECSPLEVMETVKRLTKFAGVVKEDGETDDEFARRSGKKLLECIESRNRAELC